MKRVMLVTILTIGWSASALAFSVADAEQCYQATIPDGAIQYCTRAIQSGDAPWLVGRKMLVRTSPG